VSTPADPSTATATTRPVRRRPLLAFVALVLIIAAAFAFAGSGSSPAPARAPALAAATMPPSDARSSAWYCVAGTANRGGTADETLVVANVGDRPLRADVEVTTATATGAATAPVRRRLDVAARGQARLRVGDVVATPNPGVVVETIGSPAIVEHEIRNGAQLAAGPCARHASPGWYLPAGTTAKGALQTLALFDPFGDDAIVDVTFLTDGGPLSPEDLQGLVVPRRSRVTVPVHDEVRRRTIVATMVQARVGRVVAEQSLAFDGTAGRSGLTLALGSPTTATDWFLPAGSFVRGPDTMTLMNPSDATASVTVEVVLDGAANLSPQTVAVPDHSVTNVDLLARVPANISFWVRLHADNPIVAGQLTSGGGGATTVMPSALGARRWWFAFGRVTDVSADSIIVANPSSRAGSVRLDAVRGGTVTPVATARTVAPGARTSFDLRAARVPTGAALVVTAGTDVVAERVNLAAPAITAALGVPDVPDAG
jgi:hypothetical protein